MQKALTLYQTTIGKKTIMAVSGIVLVGFVVGHLVGNLQVYLGPDAINNYSAFLHANPALLWGTRATLLLAVLAHVSSAVQLATRNLDARPVGYKKKKDVATDYAARTMIWSGPLLSLFIVYHLLHLTFGYTPGNYQHDPMDVYSNLVHGFQIPLVSGFYIASMFALGFHLYHGIWSLFQSLGLNHPRYNEARRHLAVAITGFVVAGNISIPVSILLGFVQ